MFYNSMIRLKYYNDLLKLWRYCFCWSFLLTFLMIDYNFLSCIFFSLKWEFRLVLLMPCGFISLVSILNFKIMGQGETLPVIFLNAPRSTCSWISYCVVNARGLSYYIYELRRAIHPRDLSHLHLPALTKCSQKLFLLTVTFQ